MQTLVEDFLQYLRHERGQAVHTARTYAALLGRFTAWAGKQSSPTGGKSNCRISWRFSSTSADGRWKIRRKIHHAA